MRCLIQSITMRKLVVNLLCITSFAIANDYADQNCNNQKDLKILVLIIASDQDQLYRNLQHMWKTYMHYDRAHVEAYFIKGDPNLTEPLMIKDDVIWSKTVEDWRPGILNKTILSMEAVMPRLHEFDYVLRTNLSSFYVFPRLLKFLETCPRTNFYGGSDAGKPEIGSGCGFLLSPDLVEMLVQNKQCFMNDASDADDQLIGIFLRDHGYNLYYHARYHYPSMQEWRDQRNNLSEDAFHFRLKGANHADEIAIYQELIAMFYSMSRSYNNNVLFYNDIKGSLIHAKKVIH